MATVARWRNAWIVTLVTGSALFYAVWREGTVDDCGREITSNAPMALWIAALVVSGSSAVFATIARQVARTGLWASTVVAMWLLVPVGFIYFVAMQIGLPSGCDYGRPVRRHGEVLLPRVRRARGRARTDLDGAMAGYWLRIARGEYASITAFELLRADLLRLGAPDTLLGSCSKAAADERRHAALAAALVTRWSGAVPRFRMRVPARDRPVDLETLAVESLLDGCLNEGAAAVEASLRLERTEDQQTIEMLQVIARDETDHAELGWAIVDWATQAGGTEVRAALDSAAARLPGPRRGIPLPAGADSDALRSLGWIDDDVCRRAHELVVAELTARLTRCDAPRCCT